MKAKQSFVVLVLIVILQRSDQRATSELTETGGLFFHMHCPLVIFSSHALSERYCYASLIIYRFNSLLFILTARQKRVIGYNAFSNDINKCLFVYWTPYIGKNPNPSLGERVDCNGIGLCYGANTKMAQYAACYNQKSLIPEFTGHIVFPNIGGDGRDNEFRADTGIGKIFLLATLH